MTPKPSAREVAVAEYLRKVGVLPVVENQIRRLSAPFYWYGPEGGSEEQAASAGTICFVHTGRRLLGVSACHVHDACVEALRDSNWTCQIGASVFHPAEHVIDRNDDLDLVTYHLSEIQVMGAGADIHYAPEWPPRMDAKGMVIVGGWLNQLQTQDRSTSTHSFLHIIARTDKITSGHISVVTYTSSSHAWGDEGLPPETQLGGMSGGPVFLVREDPLTKLYLIGIVYEYQPGLEIMFARPLSLIDEQGRIEGGTV